MNAITHDTSAFSSATALSNVVAFAPRAVLDIQAAANDIAIENSVAAFNEHCRADIAELDASEPTADEPVEIAAEAVEPEPDTRCAVGEFTIGRAALTAAIVALSRVVEKRSVIPILSNVLFTASAGTLILTATDLDAQLVAMAECGPGDFSATLPAHLLSDILKRGADSDEVGFRADGEGHAVSVFWGALKYRLQALSPSDFPVLSVAAFSHRFTMPGKQFRDMLAVTAKAMSKEETRYYLNGVFLHTYGATTWIRDDETGTMVEVHAGGNRPELRMTATDGHRLYRMDIEMPDGCYGMPGVIVPRRAVELFQALAKGKACPETVAIEVSDTKIRMSFDTLELTSKLIDGSFPDYQRVIPTGNDLVSTFSIAKAAEALASVAVISSERGRAVKLTLTHGAARMTVNNPDCGSAEAAFPCELRKHGVDEPEIEIGFNASYLSTILADLADDGDEITGEFNDAGSPTIFRSGREGLMAVLMPMRV